MKIVPDLKPQLSRSRVQEILDAFEVDENYAVLIGIRGYYLRSFGNKAKNDRAIYDDAIILVTRETLATFNANCDPMFFRKGIANLCPGVWKYKLGIHGVSKPAKFRYQALVQADTVRVDRDGESSERGFFGINIHKGGYNSTSSLGCQTIYPTQWEAFMALVKLELSKRGQRTIPYILIENHGDIA